MKHGNFDKLADNYGRYRPGYSPTAARTLVLLAKDSVEIPEVADVGAGTGIWTRLLAGLGCRATAIEPSGPMRQVGASQNGNLAIEWRAGSAEETGLESGRFDLVTMASSFHWPDYAMATTEFHRILRPGGYFCAIWNPRKVEDNPLLLEIESELKRRVPELNRVSSGRSQFCETLYSRLQVTPGFGEVLYLEAQHIERQSAEHYLGLWRSVNDIRVQAGEERFNAFLDWVTDKIAAEPYLEATYLTRAWIARRTG